MKRRKSRGTGGRNVILGQIFAIANVSFKELLREKILWGALVFAFLCVGLAYGVSQLSFAENARIAITFGLTSVSIVGGLLSIIMGSALIAQEVNRRTIYLLLSKAIWRWQFVVGRLGGLLGILAVNAIIMTGIAVAIFLFLGGKWDGLILKSLFLQIVEFAILASIAGVFSSFSSIPLAAIVTSGIWIIGHAVTDFRLITTKIEPVLLRRALEVVSYALPDLTRFDVKAQVAHQLPVAWSYVALSGLYGVSYVLFAVVLACLIFSWREL